MNYYERNMDHVYDEIIKTDMLINLELIRHKKTSNKDDLLGGLYITEEEINRYLQYDSPIDEWFARKIYTSAEYDTVKKAMLKKEGEISGKVTNSLEQGISLHLPELSSIFSLNSLEYAIVLITLGHQLDSKYSKFFSYLQDDITKKNPTVEMLLNFVCDTYEQKITARDLFSPQRPLFRYKLLEFTKENSSNIERPLLQREVKLNNRITGFILETTLIDDDISKICALTSPSIPIDSVPIEAKKKKRIKNLLIYLGSREDHRLGNNVISLYGDFGDQKKDVAAAICKELNVPLLETDMATLLKSEHPFEESLNLILRESRLIPCAILFKNASLLLEDKHERAYDFHYFITSIDSMSWLSFLDTEEAPKLHGNFVFNKYFEIELNLPEYTERLSLWRSHISSSPADENIDFKKISSKFMLNSTQIRDAVNTASNIALWNNPVNPVVSEANIIEACHLHSSKKLKDLAVYIKPRYRWSDIVLPEEITLELRQMVDMVNHRHIVYNEWGFEGKLSLGKGICALYYGPPGTGKTMAADVISCELGMELYKVDISTVVSKYIGETEKNLNSIFNTARYSNAVLFFDEADSLFGKRTEVKDSHDRYANIEISYLLQKIDEYTGVVILATNYYKNIDAAFERRIHFILNFPPPDEKARLNIWTNIFPKKTPLAKGVKFEKLAKKLKINGGNIKNIALAAAFFAAEKRSEVTMDHILRAAKKEYNKIGYLWKNDL